MDEKKSSKRGRSTSRKTSAKKTKGWSNFGVVVRRPLVSEVKSCDISSANLLFSSGSGAAATLLNDTVVGADYFNRIGRKCQGKSLRLKGFIINPLAGVLTEDYIRFAIVYDKAANSGLATWADVFSDQSLFAASTSTALSGVNMNNRDRFVILREWSKATPACNAIGAAAPGPAFNTYVQPTSEEFCINMFIPLKGMETSHSGSGNGTIQTGALLLLQQSVNNQNWRSNLQFRYRFTDV